MDTCNAVGCFKSRHKSTGGYEYSYCYEHFVQRMEGYEPVDQSKGSAEMPKTICVVEGCDKPRYVNKNGKVLTMCDDHQRADWRDKAKQKAAKQVGKVVEPAEIAIPDMAHVISRVVSHVEPGAELLPMDEHEAYPVKHDCESCTAKGVIEALRAKSPKLAKLIDAMEAQERAAFELGL